MKKSNKIILAALASVFIFSIAFQLKVNRYLKSPENSKINVAIISEERVVTDFNKISVSDGVKVYFMQDTIRFLKVEAPENIISNITTEIKNEELIITKNGKTRNSDALKIFVSNDSISAIKAKSGAYFETLGTVSGKHLMLEFDSDTRANLDLSYESVKCKAASGSEVKFKGTTSNIEFTN